MKKRINRMTVVRYGKQRGVFDLLPAIGFMTDPFVISASWLCFYIEVER